ncbi:MAG: sensor histidine kinase [Anaerolineales bacterium]|nr:sensor histidine kinase [Anaerolineales bacterium]
MILSVYQANLVIVFFIYGLAFFSMGLTLLLESNRVPLLADARVLRPLIIFGILHGAHEWLEIFLLEAQWLGGEFPGAIMAGRVILLALSFIALVAFGVQILLMSRDGKLWEACRGLCIANLTLVFYLGLVVVLGETPWNDPDYWMLHTDIIARYALAFPGGILAAAALWKLAYQIRVERVCKPVKCLYVSAVGFLFYGISQLFVAPAQFGPAAVLNSQFFLDMFGFPVQVVRALTAVMVMVGLIRTLNVVEDERKHQHEAAQQERLEALERVQEELVKQAELRREILRRTVIAQEGERARIARELHDETSQTLTAFSVNMAALQNRLPEDREIEILTKRISGLSNQMAQGIYRLVHDLRPAQLDDLGLVPALRFLVDQAQSSMGLEVELSVDGANGRMDRLTETVLYRVAQEALTNVVRHAGTCAAKVLLVYDPESVQLVIKDHGQGFDVNQDHIPPHGLGLASMRERVEAVGGSFEVSSVIGSGTIVRAVISRGQKLPESAKEFTDAKD